MAVITVRCLGRGAEPLLPLKEALASDLGRTPDQIRRTLARAAPHLLDAVPFIGTFLASIGEKLAEGSFSLRGIYEELSRVLIRATSGNTGLFLLVDDLHAADPDTLYFLNYLFRKLRHVPVLVAATIQEERLADYPELADLMAEWSAAGHVTLTVVPLERAHVGEYVRMMTATGEQADEGIVDRLFRLTGGNPFFLREALALVTPQPGAPLAEDVVLPRADAILRRRLARADEMTRHFLRAASVVLDTSDDLAPITYVMEADTKDAIAALNKACGIRLMREGPHWEVSFVHALMQREVYTEMGANQRRYLHARAGSWFEGNGAMASAAFHFEQAGQIDQMVKAGYQAASQAERAGMYHTALMLYQKLRPHVSIEELGPRLAPATVVVGSETQYNDVTSAGMFDAVRSVSGERLQWVVVTRGRAGADAYAASGEVHVDAVAADQIDATGAGDAFTVGLLHELLQGDDMVTALQLGAAWGAATAAQLRSIPVPWEELAGPFHQPGTLGLLAADAIERGPPTVSGLQAAGSHRKRSRLTELPGRTRRVERRGHDARLGPAGGRSATANFASGGGG
jgi:hypothetical protein